MKYETYVSYLELTLWQHIKDICTFLLNSAQKIYNRSIWWGMERKMPPLIRFLTHPIAVYHSIKPNELVTSICQTQLMLENY